MATLKYERGFWHAYNADADRWYDAQPTDFGGVFLDHGEYGKVYVTSPGDFISFCDCNARELAFFEGATYCLGERELAMLEPLVEVAPLELAA